ncbi:MAG: transglycosylase domain-containing protein, partial [Acidobacteria bacterium]|nr:transglycosylase domain-containing protein [Acidobacteriota bacterium]
SVYAADGRLLFEFYRENRQQIPLSQMPPVLTQATIATEDKRFYEHWGVDLWGIRFPTSL